MQKRIQTADEAEVKYEAAIYELKCVLNLSQYSDDIPAHILICKAVALLNVQFDEIRKTELLKQRNSQWDEPKYKPKSNVPNKYYSKRNGQALIRHDTRHFYSKEQKTQKEDLDHAFCSTIQSTDSIELPPIDWNLDNEDDTNEIDTSLQTEAEQKLIIKVEDLSNELSNEWTDSFSMICDDEIDFDVPLEMQFSSDFI